MNQYYTDYTDKKICPVCGNKLNNKQYCNICKYGGELEVYGKERSLKEGDKKAEC